MGNTHSQISEAVKQGNLDEVKWWIFSSGYDVNTADHAGWTILHGAACFNHEHIVSYLLDRKQQDVDINSSVMEKVTPLQLASMNGHESIVKLLIDKGADLECKFRTNHTPLIIASENGHFNIVKLLLDSGANINAVTTEGGDALFLASQYGHALVVKILIDKKANLESRTNTGFTPLITASELGHLSVVKLLLKSGANVNAVTDFNETALFRACMQNQTDVVKLLMDFDADVNIVTRANSSPLYFACQHGDQSMVKHILTRNPVIDSRHESGATPFMQACESNHIKVAMYMLLYGADINACAKDGNTALHIATWKRNLPLVQALLLQNAHISRNNNGMYPQDIARELQFEEIVFEIEIHMGGIALSKCTLGEKSQIDKFHSFVKCLEEVVEDIKHGLSKTNQTTGNGQIKTIEDHLKNVLQKIYIEPTSALKWHQCEMADEIKNIELFILKEQECLDSDTDIIKDLGDKHILLLAFKLDTDWRSLADHLDILDNEVENMTVQFGNNAIYAAWNMLTRWRHKCTESNIVKLGILQDTTEKITRKDLWSLL